MFRYLIYRTDIGNTIVRESAVSGTTGGNEDELFTDFTIPEIQPLYLYRVTGGTDVVVNEEANITTYLEEINPLNADSSVSFGLLTGYTATTQTEIDGKLDEVPGAVNNNIPVFSGNGSTLVDSGFSITDLSEDSFVTGVTYQGSTLTLQRNNGLADLTATITTSGSSDGVVSGGTLNGSELVLERSQGLPDVTIELSGLTNGKLDTSVFNSYTGDTQPIIDTALTGATNGLTVSGRNVLLGGSLTQNTTIAGGGFNVSLNGLNEFNLAFSGASTITDSGNQGGLKYATDYSPNFNERSLVDKAYVDSVATGLDVKDSVRLATTSGETDIDLTGGTFSTGSIDGVTLADGDRVLIKNQDSNQEQNGIYIYSASTSGFTRSEDADGSPANEVTSGMFTFIEEGDDNANKGFVLTTNDPITVGTTPLVFGQFSAAGSYIGGVGIIISGQEISLDGGGVAGDFLTWTGSQFNVTGLTSTVDFNAYTAATQTALDAKLDTSVFNSYTGDTQNALDEKLDITVFTGYTATTDTRLVDIEADVSFISGVTDNKLDIATFNTYTGTSSVNEIQLVHTGTTQINNIIPTALVWDIAQYSGSSYSYTGGSEINVTETGDYIISYNVVLSNESNANKSLGANIIVDNSTVIDETASAASIVQGTGNASILVLASTKVTLTAGTKIELAVFRNGNSGDVNTVENSSTIRIAKDSTLQ